MKMTLVRPPRIKTRYAQHSLVPPTADISPYADERAWIEITKAEVNDQYKIIYFS